MSGIRTLRKFYVGCSKIRQSGPGDKWARTVAVSVPETFISLSIVLRSPKTRGTCPFCGGRGPKDGNQMRTGGRMGGKRGGQYSNSILAILKLDIIRPTKTGP